MCILHDVDKIQISFIELCFSKHCFATAEIKNFISPADCGVWTHPHFYTDLCPWLSQVRRRAAHGRYVHTTLPTHTHTHTHTHPFNGPLSGTTQVSQYQKGKTNLDLTEARDSEWQWQWNPLGHMQVCTSLQTDNHASTSLLSFLQAGCPSCRPTNSVKALKATLNTTNCSLYFP